MIVRQESSHSREVRLGRVDSMGIQASSRVEIRRCSWLISERMKGPHVRQRWPGRVLAPLGIFLVGSEHMWVRRS